MTSIPPSLGAVAQQVTRSGSAGRVPGPVVVLAAGIVTAVVGTMAYIGYRAIKGETPDALAATTLELYDHNRNGVIELDPSVRPLEFLRTETRREEDEHGWNRTETDVYDGSRLLAAADADSSRTVNEPELRRLFASHDHDGNGRITPREGWKFDSVVGEELVR